jgi:hypothetical protein
VISPIETRYNGYRFRSRLEARWAVFFDALGIKYEYEKEGFQLGSVRYLPDFYLPDHKVYIEIKGDRLSEDDRQKVLLLREAANVPVYVAAGAIGDHRWLLLTEDDDIPEFKVTNISLSHDAAQTMALPHDNDWGTPDWGVQAHCPICGDNYVHIGDAETRHCDDYSAWQGRGAAIRIAMSCEQGHEWTLRLGFHKGGTFIAIENPVAITHDPGMWLANGNLARYDKSIAKARAARFEHGEQP